MVSAVTAAAEAPPSEWHAVSATADSAASKCLNVVVFIIY
jgi:hypothetical protein